MQTYVDKFVAPVWGTPAKLVKTTGFQKGAWAISFLDDADQPGALAYHDLSPDGLPHSKVFVKTSLATGNLVSVSASHQLVEMLVDPALNRMTIGPDPKLIYAYQTADPVQALTFDVDGIPMSNFVYPAYFETFRKPGSVQFDQMNKVKKPFQVLSGCYQTVCKNGGWSMLFGSALRAPGGGRRGAQQPAKKLFRPEIAKVKRLARLF